MDRFYPQCEHKSGGISANESSALWIKPVGRNRPGEAATVAYGDCNENSWAQQRCTSMGEGVIRETLKENLPSSRWYNGHQRRRQGTDLREKTYLSIGSGIEQWTEDGRSVVECSS